MQYVAGVDPLTVTHQSCSSYESETDNKSLELQRAQLQGENYLGTT
jgi:hypothetical protein